MAALNRNISNVTCEMVADAIMFLRIVHEAPRQSGVYHSASPDSIHTAALLPSMLQFCQFTLPTGQGHGRELCDTPSLTRCLTLSWATHGSYLTHSTPSFSHSAPMRSCPLHVTAAELAT